MRKGGLVSGITLLTLGLVFLADNLGLMDMSVSWPLVMAGVGLALLIRYFRSR